MAAINRNAQTKTTQTNQAAVQKPTPAPAAAAPEIGLMQAAFGSPLNASPQAMLRLQRAYGNRAVTNLVQRASGVGAEGGDLSSDVASQVQSARGRGQPLD